MKKQACAHALTSTDWCDHQSVEAQKPSIDRPSALTSCHENGFILQTKTKARIYPAYHTAYDTFDYASRYIDPGGCPHAYITHSCTHQNTNNKGIQLVHYFISNKLPLIPNEYISYVTPKESVWLTLLCPPS